ncbi:Nitrite/Sulfite reductase ferredoxin-like half domain-containing protein [Geosporobacter subterraneus DSM 17957]|uniref:Nitrite/Sulfite reductase ferredoxin-like half domain-containing protein n=1 Tax=Geosporobacter subterraneus DSM 17957 TaxID=1121919 RepID=A0A1M6N4M3_9FIRM|nr:NAD(P)/FAD-dependent oxidoreductase [Geosporobacter subterraneus]SHJ90553.1 Nitrite/Sulfite reductase ferredoxin-like half domain-containing protein [Geosporobacter subterraneus DSM 17957]
MDAPKYATLQKVRNGNKTYGVTPRIPGGFIKPEQLIKIAEVASKYNGTLKITSGQRVAILGLQPEDVDKVWTELGMEPAVLSPYSVKNVEMCPASFCKRAKQNSLRLGMKLEKALYGAPAPNRTKVGVAGCRNACTSVYSKDIGVIADVDGYMVTVGGSAGFHQRLSDIVTVGLTEDDAFALVKIIMEYYNQQASTGEKMGDFIDRITFAVFQREVMERFKKDK